MATRFFVGSLAIVLALGLVFAPGAQAADKVAQHNSVSFPEYAETEYEQSIITIPIYSGESADPVEILKLTAFMRLERERPTRNGLGHRQVEFTIAEWELYGYSEFLDADVTFKLSDVPVQPKSLVISLTEEADYPAMIVYNAIYDIYIGQKLVAKNRPGVAFAKNVFEIPPRNISVAFTKPFAMPEDGLDKAAGSSLKKKTGADVNLPGLPGDCGPIGGTCPYAGCWCPGTCEDMFQITQAEFNQGVALGRAIRAGQHTLKKN